MEYSVKEWPKPRQTEQIQKEITALEKALKQRERKYVMFDWIERGSD